MASKLRDIARIMGKTEANNPDNSRLLFSGENLTDSAETIRIASDTAMAVYTGLDSLPITNLTAGQHAYVSSTNRYYISNGTGWYNVSTANATPYWDTEPNSSYDITDSATPLIIIAKARDSDNSDQNLLHQSTVTDSAAFLVDITRDSSVFTFTPKSQDSIGASVTAGDLTDSNTNDFIYTFKWSDGINFVSKAVTINYNFSSVLNPFGDGSLVAFYKLDGDGTDETGNYDATGYRSGSATGFSSSVRQIGTHSLNPNYSTTTILDLPDVVTSYGITVSAWVRPSNWNDASNNVVLNTTIGGNRVTFCLNKWSGQSQMYPMIMFGGGDHITYNNYSGINFISNFWYHVIWTASAYESGMAYVNGVKAGTTVNHGGEHGGGAGWALGGNYATTEVFEGYIDHVKIFNRALTDSEATQSYNDGLYDT